MEISLSGRLIRRLVKRWIYSSIYLRETVLLLLGRTKPYVRFTVESIPPSVFYNFRIRPDRVEDFTNKLNLPRGFSLAKIRFLEQDSEPAYYISLNVYRVTGITNARRAEWSVFVTGEEENPNIVRYLVVEAQSSSVTMDPIGIFVRARKVEHSFEGNKLETYVESFNKTFFHAVAEVSDKTSLRRVNATREWLQAIDLIYWLNGIGDRTYYNGSMACAEILSIPPAFLKVEDTTGWREFVESVPDHVLIFQNSIEFVMSPWWNI